MQILIWWPGGPALECIECKPSARPGSVSQNSIATSEVRECYGARVDRKVIP
jgi:hypothetical protein